MSPDFAQAVDPIFLCAFDTVDAIEKDPSLDADIVRRDFLSLIHDADSSLNAEREGWKSGRYALTAWIDEMLIKGVEWNETERWQTTPLEEHVFGSAIAYKEYFRRAQLVEEQGEGGDAIEMYFVCVLLGFQGMYAARSTDELADWVGARGQFVERTRQRTSGTKEMAPERKIRTATPFRSRAFLVWPWVLLAVIIGLNALYYLWPIT